MKPKRYIRKPLLVKKCESCGGIFNPYGNRKVIRFCGSTTDKLSCSRKHMIELNKKAYRNNPEKHRVLVKNWIDSRPNYERDRMRKYRASGYIEPKRRKEIFTFNIARITNVLHEATYTAQKKKDRLLQIATLFNSGKTQREIAHILKLSVGRICQLVQLLKAI